MQNGPVLGDSVARRRSRTTATVLLAAVVLAASGCGGHRSGDDAAGAAVARAKAEVARALTTVGAYRGPPHGPSARPSGLVVFVAADLSNGGIAGVARGVQQAARAIGWRIEILDGQATVQGRRSALREALRLRPAGIILGGFNAAEQQPALRRARALGIPVVGWHSTAQPGPDRELDLFTNVTTDPAAVAHLAASYAIADSDGMAGAVIFTDSEYAIATYKSDVMAATLRKCPRCTMLQIVDTPIATAQIRVPSLVTALLQRYGRRITYILAINGAYVAGARVGLFGAGRSGDQPPFSIAAGDGDASEFARIRAGDYQKATVAEPLNLQGWQLIDELNRARAGQPPSGYVAPPRLITADDVPNGAVFDPPSGYRRNYLRIWRG